MITSQQENLFQTIVVPVDGSELTESALTMAFGVARKFNARVIVCNAVESTPITTGEFAVVGYPDAIATDQLRRDSEQIVAAAIERAHKAGVTRVDAFVSETNPVKAILTLARREKADLIIMGSHGHNGLKRMLLGSTTEAVMRRSPIPVLVVRQPDRAIPQETLEHAENDTTLRSFEYAAALP